MIGDAQTAIVNSALFWLGNEPVADLTDASLAMSNAAVKLMRVIETARDTVLARHGWTCALEYTTLNPATIANYVPPPRYPTVFLLPPDAVRVWEIEGQTAAGLFYQGWEPRWQIGTTQADGSTRLIIRAAPPGSGADDTNGLGWEFGQGWSSAPSSGTGVVDPSQGVGAINVIYVRRCAWDALDANIADAIALYLAARGCYSVTGDQMRASSLTKQAEQAVLLAIGSESTQEGGQPPLAPSIPSLLRRLVR